MDNRTLTFQSLDIKSNSMKPYRKKIETEQKVLKKSKWVQNEPNKFLLSQKIIDNTDETFTIKNRRPSSP